jgi:hypothetical protein
MNRLRSLFKPAKTESSLSQGITAQNFIAPSSNFNHVVGQQYNITNVYPAAITLPASASSSRPRSQTPFNDAPIDNLSTHFAGRKRELALIAKAFKKRRNIPLRCALHGNQGVGKSKRFTKGFADSSASSIIRTNRIQIRTLD